MPFTAEYKRELRAIERLKKELVPQLYTIAEARDKEAGKNRFKSEVFNQLTLARIWTGAPWKETQEEDDKRTSSVNRKKKKAIIPWIKDVLGVEPPDYRTIEEFIAGFDNWLAWRDRARKDLFWLGGTVLQKWFEPGVHEVICDQFVKKNFDGAFPEGYTINDVHDAIDRQERYDHEGRPTKEMILLDSRGFHKSTVDGIDAIQWMLNVPDIRIFLLTGEYKLGNAFLKEIKGYLYLAEGAEPSNLHLLFPEYIVRGVDGTSKEALTLDVRRHNQASPTIWVNSIDSNLSGWHCDVKKADDVVTDSNSNSEDTREAIKNKFDGTGPGKILDDWGFSDIIGTRYFPKDLYGTRLQSYLDNPTENTLKYFCRGCWTVKPEFVDVPLRELTEDMVILTFPRKRKFKALRQMLLNNETDFRCQQLNEPAGLDKDEAPMVHFSEDMLRLHILPVGTLPKPGEVFICWDWALTANKTSDYSVGVAALIYIEKDKYIVRILEIIYGRWVSSELALRIVLFNKKWNPKSTLIEASAGSNLLWDAIRMQAIKYGVTMDAPIWKPPSLQANAKRNRIIGLQTLLEEDRLWFMPGIWMDETIHQLVNYTGRKKNLGRKDDIPDAMSYISLFLPNGPLRKDSEEMLEFERQQKDKARRQRMYDRIFNNFQTEPTAPMSPESPRSGDPRNRIFGNNGMHI